MAKTDETPKVNKFERNIANFLGSKKNLLIGIAIAIVVVVALLWLGISITEKKATANQVKIDNLQVSFNEWVMEEEFDVPTNLIAELKEFAGKKGTSYPIVKANYLLGLISFYQEEFQEAKDLFLIVAEKGKSSYFGSLGLVNAAVASEQLNDNQGALEYYQRLYDRYGSEAAEAPKALFGIARLHETNGDIELAKAILQQLADEFPASEYAKLAQTRLILLP
jgi:TolA-binding protein